jgi:hypothetical protein
VPQMSSVSSRRIRRLARRWRNHPRKRKEKRQ